MQIPLFPRFTPFSKEALKKYHRDIYRDMAYYSDFSINNFSIWLNYHGDLELSLLDGNIVGYCTNILYHKPTFFIFGNRINHTTVEKVLLYAAENNLDPSVEMLPESAANELAASSRLLITPTENRDNYIYLTRELTQLTSPPTKRLRRIRNTFLRDLEGRYELHHITQASPEQIHSFINRIHLWDQIYHHNDSNREEAGALNISLNNFLDGENVSVFALSIDGQIEAFAFGNHLDDHDCVVINHLKYNSSYPNLAKMCVLLTAAELHRKGVTYLNLEPDEGIAGLRRLKTDLRPYKKLRFYTARLQGEPNDN